jgi:hypothetical protein
VTLYFFCLSRIWRSDSWRRLGWSRRNRRGTRGWSQTWTFARIRSEYIRRRRGWSYGTWWAGLQHQSAEFGQYAGYHASDQASSTPTAAATTGDSATGTATSTAAICTGKTTSRQKEECLGFLAFFAVYFVLLWHIIIIHTISCCNGSLVDHVMDPVADSAIFVTHAPRGYVHQTSGTVFVNVFCWQKGSYTRKKC